MRTLAILLLLLPSVPFAQTAETTLFRAVMLPASEVPAINGSSAHGVADVTASVLRDSSGQIVSGTVDILARITFPAAVTATGLGIYSGASGQNGTLALATSLSAAGSYAVQANGDSIHLAIQVTGGSAAALSALRSVYQNPEQFYVNLITTANPNGAMRGQLQKTQIAVLLGLMSSADVLPSPAWPPAYGVAQVVAIGTKSATGTWTSGELYLSATYNSQDQSTITSFQIHSGSTLFSAAVPAGLSPAPDGSGTLGPYYLEISVTTAAQTAAFSALFTDPSALYIDVHSAASPAGVLRAALRATDAAAFAVTLSSANEALPPSASAAAPATLTLYTVRNPDGSLAGATFLPDLDYRFAAAQQFLSLQLQNAAAGADGPPLLTLASNFSSDSGFGNFYGWTFPMLDSTPLRDLVRNPANYYLNLHTVADPAGAARAQLAAPPGNPQIAAVVPATLDSPVMNVAPGSLISIFGAGLCQVPASLAGWQGQALPFELNGATVTIANFAAPLVYVSPAQINAQLPFEVPAGMQRVVVSNRGIGAGFPVNVVPAAPSVFIYPVTAILKNTDFSLVTAANPAKPGDIVLVYATGLGQTAPPVATAAAPAAGSVARTAPVTVTIGGLPAEVLYSIASPGFPGLYQIAVTVPAGLTGSQPLVVQESGVASPAVTIALK